MSGELVVDDIGPVAVISFNRPSARNALTLAMLHDLADLLTRGADRPDLRAIVLRGAGDLPFSAGYDMDELPTQALTADDARKIHAPVRAVADAILACPHPVIGVARKFVFGAALDIFAHCDLRVCAEGTTFCMPPNKFGFLYPDEGLQRLVAVAGLSQATAMLMLGTPIVSADALACGLVQRVVAAGAFEEDLHALCSTVAGNAPLSMRATKRALQAIAAGQGTRASTEQTYESIAACLNSEDVREAMAAFREKRVPVFRGR